jgi:hypothetical protein
MKKRFLVLPVLWMMAATLSAQDMPPLPDLPNQAPATNGSGPSAMPPLPDQTQSAAPATNGAAALPPLPDQSAAPASNTAPPPGDQGQVAPAPASPAMPPLPGDQGQAVSTPSAPSDQGQAAVTAPSTSPEAEQAAPSTKASGPPQETNPKKAAKAIPSWKVSKWRPNTLFDGWVLAKGGNESSRLAWTSQEILNTFLFKGYKNLPEEGVYDGEGKKEWRRFTFQAPRSKQTFHVYIKAVGKKVWLRVRPGEPALPAAFTLAQVRKMRQTDLNALHLLQKKLKGRLRPGRVIVSWEPSHYPQAAGEEDE